LAEPRRLPVLFVLVAALVGALLVGRGSPATGSAAPVLPAPSSAPVTALSSSWFCAGATEYPDSIAAGQLLLENAGPRLVTGTAQLVSQNGYEMTLPVSLAPGQTTAVVEQLPGLAGSNSDHWVGAIVNLYGGMASVTQVITSAHGSASQPCATSASARWYFPYGAALRNAWDVLTLLNPYSVPAVADLSFTTDQGQEQPLAFEAVEVRADSLAVVNLGSHLRRRQHIAATVTTRSGRIVAFETELVNPPPAGAAPVGTPGAVNPVVPVPGVMLALGSTQAASSLWWPSGGEGAGETETYAIYNPSPGAAQLSLDLLPGTAANTPGSSSALSVPGNGAILVTTNDQPWALPGVAYAAHLVSTNGVPVVAARVLMAAPPATSRGLAMLLGQSRGEPMWMVSGGLSGGSSFVRSQQFLGAVWLGIVDASDVPATVSVEELSGGKLAPLSGLSALKVEPGHHVELQLPDELAGDALVVTGTRPVLIEQDWYSSLLSAGTNLAPATQLAP